MKSLTSGEQIKELFTIDCKFGRSTLYLSNKNLMIESPKGIVLELDYLSILSVQPIKKLLKIVWREENNVYDFVFSYEKQTELISKYKVIFDTCTALREVGVQTSQPNEVITIQNPVIEPSSQKEPIEVRS